MKLLTYIILILTGIISLFVSILGLLFSAIFFSLENIVLAIIALKFFNSEYSTIWVFVAFIYLLYYGFAQSSVAFSLTSIRNINDLTKRLRKNKYQIRRYEVSQIFNDDEIELIKRDFPKMLTVLGKREGLNDFRDIFNWKHTIVSLIQKQPPFSTKITSFQSATGNSYIIFPYSIRKESLFDKYKFYHEIGHVSSSGKTFNTKETNTIVNYIFVIFLFWFEAFFTLNFIYPVILTILLLGLWFVFRHSFSYYCESIEEMYCDVYALAKLESAKEKEELIKMLNNIWQKSKRYIKDQHVDLYIADKSRRFLQMNMFSTAVGWLKKIDLVLPEKNKYKSGKVNTIPRLNRLSFFDLIWVMILLFAYNSFSVIHDNHQFYIISFSLLLILGIIFSFYLTNKIERLESEIKKNLK